jgi:hypothetical protein
VSKGSGTSPAQPTTVNPYQLTRIRPSNDDCDRLPTTKAIAHELGDAPEVYASVGVGRVRGLLLHKLTEEVLTGEHVGAARINRHAGAVPRL